MEVKGILEKTEEAIDSTHTIAAVSFYLLSLYEYPFLDPFFYKYYHD